MKKENYKKIIGISSTIISIVIIISGIYIYSNFNKNNKIDNKELYPKYIFLFIGDGMSSTQVELTEIYQNVIKNNQVDEQELLSFSKFPTIALRKNYSKNDYTPDSAEAATALATGILTYNGSVNIDMDGNEITPITYDLQKQGKKIGIITTVPINHATPAGFYAHNKSRDNYQEIADDLFESGFEYFAGGYISQMTNEEIQAKAKENNYVIVDDTNKLNNMNKNDKNIVISPSASESGYLPMAIDNKTDFNLANYVKKGIEVLDNDNGFFIMAESGMIDTAGHNNDAKGVISEVQELDEAVKVALDFAKNHPQETLIIVTGDHETGGLTLGHIDYEHKTSLKGLEKQKYSYNELSSYSYRLMSDDVSYAEMLNYLRNNYGIERMDLYDLYDEVKKGNNYVFARTIIDMINETAGVTFTTSYHTADRIPIYVYGTNNEKFSGVYDSSEFNKILREAIGLKK